MSESSRTALPARRVVKEPDLIDPEKTRILGIVIGSSWAELFDSYLLICSNEEDFQALVVKSVQELLHS